jgi:hypothetical protein
MLIALVLITLAVTLLIIVLLVFLCAGIRREEHGPELGCHSPTLLTALTRRVLGLYVRRPLGPGSTEGSRMDSPGTSRCTTSHRGGGAA